MLNAIIYKRSKQAIWNQYYCERNAFRFFYQGIFSNLKRDCENTRYISDFSVAKNLLYHCLIWVTDFHILVKNIWNIISPAVYQLQEGSLFRLNQFDSVLQYHFKIILVILMVVAVASSEPAIPRISPLFFTQENQDQLLNSRMIRDSGNWQNRLLQLDTFLNKE